MKQLNKLFSHLISNILGQLNKISKKNLKSICILNRRDSSEIKSIVNKIYSYILLNNISYFILCIVITTSIMLSWYWLFNQEITFIIVDILIDILTTIININFNIKYYIPLLLLLVLGLLLLLLLWLSILYYKQIYNIIKKIIKLIKNIIIIYIFILSINILLPYSWIIYLLDLFGLSHEVEPFWFDDQILGDDPNSSHINDIRRKERYLNTDLSELKKEAWRKYMEHQQNKNAVRCWTASGLANNELLSLDFGKDATYETVQQQRDLIERNSSIWRKIYNEELNCKINALENTTKDNNDLIKHWNNNGWFPEDDSGSLQDVNWKSLYLILLIKLKKISKFKIDVLFYLLNLKWTIIHYINVLIWFIVRKFNKMNRSYSIIISRLKKKRYNKKIKHIIFIIINIIILYIAITIIDNIYTYDDDLILILNQSILCGITSGCFITSIKKWLLSNFQNKTSVKDNIDVQNNQIIQSEEINNSSYEESNIILYEDINSSSEENLLIESVLDENNNLDIIENFIGVPRSLVEYNVISELELLEEYHISLIQNSESSVWLDFDSTDSNDNSTVSLINSLNECENLSVIPILFTGKLKKIKWKLIINHIWFLLKNIKWKKIIIRLFMFLVFRLFFRNVIKLIFGDFLLASSMFEIVETSRGSNKPLPPLPADPSALWNMHNDSRVRLNPMNLMTLNQEGGKNKGYERLAAHMSMCDDDIFLDDSDDGCAFPLQERRITQDEREKYDSKWWWGDKYMIPKYSANGPFEKETEEEYMRRMYGITDFKKPSILKRVKGWVKNLFIKDNPNNSQWWE